MRLTPRPSWLLAALFPLAAAGCIDLASESGTTEASPGTLTTSSPATVVPAAKSLGKPDLSTHEGRLKAQDAALTAKLAGQLLRVPTPPSDFLQGRSVVAWIYLPPGYDDSDRRYPVAYILHGAPGGVRDPFVNAKVHRVAEKLIVEHKIQPMILVGFEGEGPRGLDDVTDYLDRKDGKYQMESYVTQELVPWVDAHYRTEARAGSRALVGFSAGGYGAANLGFKHPDLFGIMASHAGFFDPNDDPEDMTGILGPHDENAALWDANSPLLRAGEVPLGSRLHFYMDCGRSDSLLHEFKKMEAELKARGVDFEAQIVKGDHDWKFLNRHYADSLSFCDRRFRELAVEN